MDAECFCLFCLKLASFPKHECAGESLCQPDDGVHVDICRLCARKGCHFFRLQIDRVSSYGTLTHRLEIPPLRSEE